MKWTKVTNVTVEGFDGVVPKRDARASVRKAGLRVVTRLKKRWRKSGRFRQSGQLLKSYSFRMKKGTPGGTIVPRGVRTDVRPDGPRQRPNFMIAAKQATRGHDVLGLDDTDAEFYRTELARNLHAALAKRRAELGITTENEE